MFFPFHTKYLEENPSKWAASVVSARSCFRPEAAMLAALTFVPGADVNRVFDTLSNNIDQALDVILDYIEDNYIGVFRRGHFHHVRFTYELWGIHDRVQNDLPRTNHAVEGWQNRFNQHVECHHGIIWKLIGVLKEDEDISRVNLLHIQQGRNPPNPNAGVCTAVADYANRAPLKYLKGIAYNIKV